VKDRRENAGVLRKSSFNRGNKDVFSAEKDPRQCPLVFVVTVRLRDCKTFGNGKMERWKADKLNFDVNFGRAACGEILILTWGNLLCDESLLLMFGGLHKRRAVQCGTEENSGWSHDPLDTL
jgi:hypothetical protein